MGVTLKMLAERTGFSTATISRVLNNDPTMSVGEETRRMILQAAQELGYTGSSGRRAQKTKSDTKTIAIVEMMSPEEQMADPFFLYLKNFVEHVCREKKIQTVTLAKNSSGYHAIFSTPIDGIIAIGYFSDKEIAAMQLVCENITFLDSSPDELRFDSVVINFDLGIRQAIDSLYQKKHTRIGFIGPKMLQDDHRHLAEEPRRRFFEHYMRKLRLFRSEYMVNAPLRNRLQMEQEFQLSMKSWSEEQRPTAFITVNEECAIGAVHVLREMKLKIPEDVSIISFNDTVISSVIEPRLTSISAHLEYMAAAAVQLVTQRIATPTHKAERVYPQKIVIPPELIERDSTATAKER